MQDFGTRLLLLTIAMVTTIALPDAGAAHNLSPDPSLLTTQQQELDELALSLQGEPAVKAAREAITKRWSEQHAWATVDGKATLAGAVDELVFHALRAAAADDPTRPKIAWMEAPPYLLGKTKIPGSRFAGDNPDRIYRYASVSPAYRYEIRGTRGRNPAQHEFSFEVTNAISLVPPSQVALYSGEVELDKDGGFVITADSTPPNGRRNHLQLPKDAKAVLFRDTLTDWSTDYNSLTITLLDHADKLLRSREELVKAATAVVKAAAAGPIMTVNMAWKYQANEIRPFVRPYEWGVPGNVVGINRFSLEPDEALVITLLPSNANYVGVQITDPWSRSVDYWNHTSSLSDRQAKPNPDGSLTYVISPKDPGVHNWLGTGGLHDGLVLTRWEMFPKPLPPGNADQLVREVRKVRLDELASVLPATMAKVTAAERKQQIKVRAAEFAKRVAFGDTALMR